VEVHEARALLGVAASDSWDAVRVSYRHLMRQLHPDHAGPTSTLRAAELNEAYAVLSRVMRARRPNSGRAKERGGARPDIPATPAPPPPPVGVHVDDGGEILLVDAPLHEAFTRLLEAAHAVGAVTYVDRSCAILEVVVQHGGEACSLVVTLQDRGEGQEGTEAYCTLESLERVARPAPAAVVRQLAAALRTPWVSPPRR
jgi:DnaJ domain